MESDHKYVYTLTVESADKASMALERVALLVRTGPVGLLESYGNI